MNEIYRKADNLFPKINSAYYFVQKFVAPPKNEKNKEIFANINFSSSSSIRSAKHSQDILQSTSFLPEDKVLSKNYITENKKQNQKVADNSDSDDQDSIEDVLQSQSKQLEINKNNELQRIITSFNQRINNIRHSAQNFESNDVLLKRVMELERDKWKYIDSIEQQYKQLKEIQLKQIQKLLNDS